MGDHTSYNFSVCEELLKPLGTLGFPLALMTRGWFFQRQLVILEKCPLRRTYAARGLTKSNL
jgi:hypothetical protein